MKNDKLIALYQDHDKILWDRAWSWSRTTGYDSEELYAECRLQFFYALETYDSKRGMSFASYLRMWLNSELNSFIRKYDAPKEETMEEVETLSTSIGPRESLYFKELIENLSDQGRYICNTLLNAPEKINIKPNMTPKAVRGAIRDHLREIGWTWNQIWNAFSEVKKALV